MRRKLLRSLCLFALWLPLSRSTAVADPPRVATLLLESHEPEDLRDKSYGSLLVRELARQAVLLAARDELGLATRDQSLRETVQPAEGGAALALSLAIKAPVDKPLEIWLGEPGDHGATVWKTERDLGASPFDYLALATALEGLAGAEIAPSLAARIAAGDAKPPPFGEGGVSDDVEELLGQMTWIAQWNAVRQVHTAMAQQGASPARLEALVRGYAHLGLLTEYHVSAAHKAFYARAMLYAARLRRLDPTGPASHRSLAYAAGLAGMHRRALEEIELAQAAAPPDSPTPGWLALVSAACRYDEALLKQRPDDPRLVHLAALLQYTVYENTNCESLWLAAGQRALEAAPECYRVAASMCRYTGVSNRHLATAWAMPVLRSSLPQRVRQVPGAPLEVVKTADKLTKLAASVDPVLSGGEAMRDFVLAACQAGAAGTDQGEPSWECLGRLAQEESVVQVAYRFDFLLRGLGVPALQLTAAMRSTQAYLVGHPTEPLLAAVLARGNTARQQQMLKGVHLRDAGMSAYPLALMTWYGPEGQQTFGQELWRQIWRHSDHLARELEQMGYFSQDAGFATWLTKVSPESPQAVALKILIDAKTSALFRRGWEDKYADRAVVLRALVIQLANEKNWSESARVLRRYLERFPDQWGYSYLAELAKLQNDTAGWRAAKLKSLEYEDYSLSHVRVMVELARHDMSEGRFEEALPNALQAAQSWAATGMSCASECLEALGRWDEAEQWARLESERYETLGWYFWCRRTGHGNVDEALALARTIAQRQSLSAAGAAQDRLATFLFLAGDEPRAFRIWQRAHQTIKNPYSALRLAISADAQQDTATRDRALREAAELGQADEPKYPHYAALARWLLADVARSPEDAPDLTTLNRLLEKLDGEELVFLNGIAARYLLQHAMVEQARPLLERVGQERLPDLLESILSGAALVELKAADPPKADEPNADPAKAES